MKIFKRNINLGRKVPVIDTPDLRDKCVTTGKLADGSVTTNKIADGAITREKIADKAITNLDNVVQEAQDTADHPTLVGEDNYVYAWNRITKTYDKTSIYVRGEGFHVSKTFDSVADMEAYTGTDLKEGDFVLIQSTPDDPDNAKLYTYSGTQGIYNYLIKMSGAIGFTGQTPQFSIGSIITIEPTEQASASLSPDGTDSDGNPKYKLNLALPKGEKGTSDFVIVDDHSGAGDDPNKIYIPSANAEKENATAIANEVARATETEQANATAIAAEEARAKAVEQENATAIADEITRAKAAEQANATAISGIEGKIPTQATAQNKLADKDFVNSSISTATANFKGTYNNIADLQAVVGADANDYGFIVTTDAAGNTVYKKYKYVTGTGWAFEYVLNNSSFTAEQWATIQSGMTAALTSKLADLPTNTALQDALTTIRESVAAEGTRARAAEKANATAIADEVTRATEAEQTNATAIAAEEARARAAEQDNTTAIAAEEARARAAEADRYTKSETYTKTEVNDLVDTPHQEYVTVDAYSNLPATGSKDTIYRVSNYNGSTSQVDITSYSEYAWNGSSYTFLCVKSQIGEVFDISVYNNNTKYADLSAALNGGVNIPQSLQKGGMSVKFVQSSDNNYIQFRCIADEFTTDVAQWQGVDKKPVSGSNNLVESGGVALEFEGNSIEQPSAQSLTNGYMGSDGAFTYGTNNRFAIVNLSKATGCHITEKTSSIIQYAFLKSYTSEQGVFVNGGSRVSGTVNNTKIPADANYLYIYIGTDTTIPVLELPDAKEGVNQKIEDIETEIQNINNSVSELSNKVEPMEDIVDAVEKLNWSAPIYTFIEANESKAILNSNIVLSQNGDSIEFKLLSCSYASFTNLKGYSFTRGGNTSNIGIGVTSSYISARADDRTWIFSDVSGGGYIGKTIKISYENGNICLYANGTLLSTYSGQKTITLLSFGNGSDYWDGSITDLKINGENYNLKNNAVLSNVSVVQDTSFLLPEEKEMLYNNGPLMMAEKTATKLTVYKKLEDNIYVGYPLNYRYASYEQCAYPSFYDNWGIGQLFLASYINNSMQRIANLFSAAEAEVAIDVPRGDGESGNVYVGGSSHGFENIATANGREFCILIDNMNCGESDVFALKEVSSIHITQGSNLYQAYTNSNPFAYITKKWDFEKECNFSITSKVKILRNITISYAQLGMFGVYRHYAGDAQNDYLTDKAIKNSQPYKVYDIDDNWWNDPDNAPLMNPDFDCTKITEYGDYNLGFALIVKDANTKESGGMFVSTNNALYNKIYYSVCNNYNAVIDEVLEGTQEWSIEGNINSLT